MKVITVNVNGIRSALKKGLFAWLKDQDPEVICLQEVRADEALLAKPEYHLPGYHCYYHSAQKPGYSGVGILSKREPDKVVRGLGFALADEEGRYIHLEWGDLTIASLYMPSGTSSEDRQALKYVFMAEYETILKNHLHQTPHRQMIVTGDWNIAHKIIDIKNWKTNQKNSGFLPQERAWLDTLFEGQGWIDAFRVVNQEADQYTWWSNRSRAFENNVGWRIDYQVITPNLKAQVKSVEIYKAQRFSDHAPLIVNYDL